jgi:hypothetical protein
LFLFYKLFKTIIMWNPYDEEEDWENDESIFMPDLGSK